MTCFNILNMSALNVVDLILDEIDDRVKIAKLKRKFGEEITEKALEILEFLDLISINENYVMITSDGNRFKRMFSRVSMFSILF